MHARSLLPILLLPLAIALPPLHKDLDLAYSKEPTPILQNPNNNPFIKRNKPCPACPFPFRDAVLPAHDRKCARWEVIQPMRTQGYMPTCIEWKEAKGTRMEYVLNGIEWPTDEGQDVDCLDYGVRIEDEVKVTAICVNSARHHKDGEEGE